MKVLGIALLIFLVCGEAKACKCAPEMSFTQAKAAYDRAFVGRITKLQCASTPGMIAMHFDVSESFKGEKTGETVVLIANDSSACGYVKPFFMLGRTYIVFAERLESGIETSRCAPNRLGLPAEKDLRVLRQGT